MASPYSIQISSAQIRDILYENAPLALDDRVPGRKKRLPRKALTADGPFHEVSCDGHDKLGHLALQMGVGLPIYGMRDKWSGAILRLVVIPNNRTMMAIGHVYLDFVQEFGGK